jgi:hypothetical protein
MKICVVRPGRRRGAAAAASRLTRPIIAPLRVAARTNADRGPTVLLGGGQLAVIGIASFRRGALGVRERAAA